LETINGSITKVVFHSEDTGFKVLVVKLHSGPHLRMVGEFGPEIIPGTIADFHGDFKVHPKYGNNFRVSSYTISFNAEKLKSIELFIDHIAPNIGPERAALIVNYFGEKIVDILDKTSERLEEVPGIGEVSAQSLKKAWDDNRDQWDKKQQEYSLRVFLNALGIKERRVKRILNYFGGGEVAEETVKKDPYKLTEIDGFGFTTADFIAKKLGVPENDPLRLRAYILYCLKTLCLSYGHLFLSQNEITDLVNKYAKESGTLFLNKQTIITSDLVELVKDLQDKGLIIVETDAIYSLENYINESNSARMISSILQQSSDLILLTRESVEKHIAAFEDTHDIEMSPEQKDALHYFAEKKVFVITGAPGTGKCLGKNTPVLMYDGSIKMVQDIVKGDYLMGDDSTPRKVLSTCTGQEELYIVSSNKETSYVVNKSHILSLKKKKKVIDISVKDYVGLSLRKQESMRGYRVPVDFKENTVPLHPYFLGYWVARGSTDGPDVLSSELMQKISDTSDTDINTKIEAPDYYKEIIEKQIIPSVYKINSRKKRLELLAGIIDSIGLHLFNSYRLVVGIKSFADDITYVARSLGFHVKLETEGSITKVVIQGDIHEIPCIIPKKRATPYKRKTDVLTSSINVDPIGPGDYYGFELDGNGRFLLGDFTVTHNTTILRAIVDLAVRLSLNLTCMTPTGISAKKMAQTIKYEAYTIHRRLGFRGNSWMHGEENKFFTDVVIIDETSMVDQEVFSKLLAALEHRVHIIFVGDDNQLPSVGAGNVLRELINCHQLPVVRLEQIFRQDEASDIIKAAHKIKNGDTDLSMFKGDPKGDIFFIRENNPAKIEDYVVRLAQKLKSDDKKFQIITARNEGPLSVKELNESLQNILNSGPEKEIILKNFKVKRGDRVIVIKNDYEIGVFNGEIGKVIDLENNFISILIDDRVVSISREEANDKLKLAYSITVHRAQGQEYPYIILPFINQFGRNLLQRNLLYTAITRAKKKVIVIGHGSALEKAINNASVDKRNTKLGVRIKSCLQREKNLSFSEQLEEQVNSLGQISREEPF